MLASALIKFLVLIYRDTSMQQIALQQQAGDICFKNLRTKHSCLNAMLSCCSPLPLQNFFKNSGQLYVV